MGVLDFFKKREAPKLTASRIIQLLNEGLPLTMINRSLYDVPEVRTAINFIAEKVAMVPFQHVRLDGKGSITPQTGKYDFVLNTRTNPYQSPFVFLTSLTTQLLLKNNAFCLPYWDDMGKLQWIYQIPYTDFNFKEKVGELFIQLSISSGGIYEFPYSDILHFQRFPSGKAGTLTQATSNYISVVSTLQAQAVNDAQSSGKVTAILQSKVNLKDADMKKKLDAFKDNFLTAENTTGMGMISSEYEIIPINLKSQPLDTKLMGDVTRAIYNYFGASYEVINGLATEMQYEQFVDNTIKPIARQIQQELTYKLFSDVELYHGNKIQAELIDLEISPLAAKTGFYDKMLYHGVFSINDVRRRLNYSSVEGGDVNRTNLNAVAAAEGKTEVKNTDGGKSNKEPKPTGSTESGTDRGKEDN